MKNILKFSRKRIALLKGKDDSLKTVFTNIFLNNNWNSAESVSGGGSSLEQTEILRFELQKFLDGYNIKSMLDVPCGDFNWMRKVNLTSVNYIGGDIVLPLIKLNRKKYSENKFELIDLTKDKLPMVDLIFVRDCFVHLSFNDIKKAVENIKKSGGKYLLTTTFVSREINEDSQLGGWRPLNLCVAPFFFPKPMLLINEKCSEGNGLYSDKCMALWKIVDL